MRKYYLFLLIIILFSPVSACVTSPPPPPTKINPIPTDTIPIVTPTSTTTLTPTIVPTSTPLPPVTLPQGRLFIGMYDPYGDYNGTKFDVYHNFVDWNFPELLNKSLDDARVAREFPMITLEPYPKKELVATHILTDITAGKYDDLISANAEVVKSFAPQQVIIRFAHQMDLCGRYDWSRCVPADYIAAFRYVEDNFKKLGATNALWEYAPVGGYDNSNDFYPGDDYVDYVGITGLVSEEWDSERNADPPHPQNYIQLFHFRYNKAALLKKPIIVPEFSISYVDLKKDKTKWLTDAIKVMNNKEKYPLLVGFVFFNVPGQPFPRIGILPNFKILPAQLKQSLEINGYVWNQ